MLNDKPEVQLDETLDIDDLDSASGGAGSGGGSSGRDGTVVALLPDAEVRVDVGGQTVTVTMPGKQKEYIIHIKPGDSVRVEGNQITHRY